MKKGKRQNAEGGGHREMQIEPYNPHHLDAVVRLSLRAWTPVFDSIQAAMNPEVYQAFYPDHWRVSQQKAVEDVCAAEDTNVWVARVFDRPESNDAGSRSPIFFPFPFPSTGYPLKAGQIGRDKKELRSFLSRFAVVALPHPFCLNLFALAPNSPERGIVMPKQSVKDSEVLAVSCYLLVVDLLPFHPPSPILFSFALCLFPFSSPIPILFSSPILLPFAFQGACL
jgi:hypothetical protein